jgi:hypothetical protein
VVPDRFRSIRVNLRDLLLGYRGTIAALEALIIFGTLDG